MDTYGGSCMARRANTIKHLLIYLNKEQKGIVHKGFRLSNHGIDLVVMCCFENIILTAAL